MYALMIRGTLECYDTYILNYCCSDQIAQTEPKIAAVEVCRNQTLSHYINTQVLGPVWPT